MRVFLPVLLLATCTPQPSRDLHLRQLDTAAPDAAVSVDCHEDSECSHLGLGAACVRGVCGADLRGRAFRLMPEAITAPNGPALRSLVGGEGALLQHLEHPPVLVFPANRWDGAWFAAGRPVDDGHFEPTRTQSPQALDVEALGWCIRGRPYCARASSVFDGIRIPLDPKCGGPALTVRGDLLLALDPLDPSGPAEFVLRGKVTVGMARRLAAVPPYIDIERDLRRAGADPDTRVGREAAWTFVVEGRLEPVLFHDAGVLPLLFEAPEDCGPIDDLRS